MFRISLRGARACLFAVAALAGFSLLLGPGLLAQDKDKLAWKDGLDGPWSVVSMTMGGQEAPPEQVQALTVTFRGGKMAVSILDKIQEGTFKVNAAKTPPHFDLHFQGKPPVAGIYRLEKDKLTLCFSEGGERPTRFESQKDTRNILLVLKRGAPRLDPVAARKLRDKLMMGAQRAQSANNLKQLALTMHVLHDINKHLPTAAIYSKDGKPLLSWRVAVLPYIEQGPLYNQFRLDESWDSPHNKKLLEQMPPLFAPVRGKTAVPHSTYYQVFTGPGTLFEGQKKIRFQDVTDGLSNTLMLVEAGEAVPWTKPADVAYTPNKDLPKLGGLFPDGFYIGAADGSVRWVNRGFDPRLFRLAITRNDGQPVDLGKLSR